MLCPGATKCVYAPEPIDVKRVLQVDIVLNGQKVMLTTRGPIQQGWLTINVNHTKHNCLFISFLGKEEVSILSSPSIFFYQSPHIYWRTTWLPAIKKENEAKQLNKIWHKRSMNI